MKKEKITIVVTGVLIGVISAMLVFFGNPANMGFCIACFLRDTTGALGLHSAAAVQYIRPEIIGLVLGACIVSLITKEFRPRGGSAPVTRFTLGAFVMIGCLMFLGCPFRMILRLAGGDGNALFGSKEDLDSQFFLQGLDAVADIALGRIEPLGGFVDGFAVGDLYHEAELLERHVGSSLRT